MFQDLGFKFQESRCRSQNAGFRNFLILRPGTIPICFIFHFIYPCLRLVLGALVPSYTSAQLCELSKIVWKSISSSSIWNSSYIEGNLDLVCILKTLFILTKNCKRTLILKSSYSILTWNNLHYLRSHVLYFSSILFLSLILFSIADD